MNTTDDPGFTTSEPLVKLGQGDYEQDYTPAMFGWTEYVLGLVTGVVVVGLVLVAFI